MTVSFASTRPAGFRAGDYWVFAARTADASVERLDRAPPRGIHHHYARLGIWDVAAGTVTDCRNPWPPPQTDGHDCSCTACVTAESHASDQFTIQDAVNQVRETGGTVCLGPGQYAVAEPVRMVGARSVRIRGQGPGTIVAGPGGVFALQDCFAVAIENLAIISLGREAAVSIRTAIGLSLRQLVIAVPGADAKGSAIALQGVVAAARISENAIFARLGIVANDPAAVPPAGEDESEPSLLASALAIEDNVLFCEREAVALNGPVLHVLNTSVIRNEVLGCAEVAISALGLGTPASSIAISANSFAITGHGIRCGLGGAWIEGNKIVNSPTGRRDPKEGTIGIAMVAGLDRNGADQRQILSNQLSGFASAGIEIDTPVRELIVKLNIIETCGSGIVVAAGSDAISVAIENNLLRDIGPLREDSDAMVIGIGLVRADAATIAGNTIRRLGLQAQRSPLRAAILTFGVLRPRVTGNEVNEVGPPDEFLGAGAGIMLRAPYTQFDVTHNRVQRDATLQGRDPIGRWSTLLTADLGARNPVSRLGKLAAVL
ncbi:MAG: right-handed parallel beta-helix repeat-containing protein, partial [Rhodoplanes sp.]